MLSTAVHALLKTILVEGAEELIRTHLVLAHTVLVTPKILNLPVFLFSYSALPLFCHFAGSQSVTPPKKIYYDFAPLSMMRPDQPRSSVINVSRGERMPLLLTLDPTKAMWRCPSVWNVSLFHSCTINLSPFCERQFTERKYSELSDKTGRRKSGRPYISSAPADWLTAVCHSNLVDIVQAGLVVKTVRCTQTTEPQRLFTYHCYFCISAVQIASWFPLLSIKRTLTAKWVFLRCGVFLCLQTQCANENRERCEL